MKRIMKRIFPLFFLILLVCSISATAATKTPGKVNRLKATTKNNTVTLSWKKASNAKGYYVYSVDKSTGKATKIKKTGSTSCTIKKLTYGKTYYYKVCAYGSGNTLGTFSSVVSVTPKLAKPSAPKYLKYTSLGNKSVNLKWTRTGSPTGYIVEAYNSSTKKYETIKKVTSNVRKVTVKNLTAGKTYKIRIRSYRKSGNAISYSSPSNVITFTATTLSSSVKAVRSCRYKATVKKTVTAKNKTTGQTITLTKGTKITVTSKNGTTVNGYLSNGNAITVRRSALKYTGLDGSRKYDYSTSVKESFVNSRGYSSKTKYFIWVSQYTYTVNIFEGSQGNWNLIKSWACVVGSWQNRTPSGLRQILKKVNEGMYNAPYVYFTSGENGTPDSPEGAKFHGLVDSKTSGAASHGCVRLKAANVWWIYNNCPIGTAVLIY